MSKQIKTERNKIKPETTFTWGGKFYMTAFVDTQVSIHQEDHRVAAQFGWHNTPASEIQESLRAAKLLRRLAIELGVEQADVASKLLETLKAAFPNGPQWRPGKVYGTWEKGTPDTAPVQTGGTSISDIQSAFASLFS